MTFISLVRLKKSWHNLQCKMKIGEEKVGDNVRLLSHAGRQELYGRVGAGEGAHDFYTLSPGLIIFSYWKLYWRSRTVYKPCFWSFSPLNGGRDIMIVNSKYDMDGKVPSHYQNVDLNRGGPKISPTGGLASRRGELPVSPTWATEVTERKSEAKIFCWRKFENFGLWLRKFGTLGGCKWGKLEHFRFLLKDLL